MPGICLSPVTENQKAYIQQFIHQLETEMYNSAPGEFMERISNYIDINSFIDYFLLNELARNVDAYKKSSYFFKDRKSNGGFLHAGPVWDFDWAWKNINECFFGSTDGSGWAFTVHQCPIWPVPPSWTVKLMNDIHFRKQVKDRYLALRNTIFSEANIFNYIDSVALVLDEAQRRHYRIWPILGINVGAPEVDYQPTTFEGEIDKFKNWITTRLNWLDTQFTSVLVTGLDDQIIRNSDSLENIRLYPNPVISELNIDVNKRISDISLLSQLGLNIYKVYQPCKKSFDVSNLLPGIYFVKTRFSDGSQWIGRFMKE